jgi:hypothetical protein
MSGLVARLAAAALVASVVGALSFAAPALAEGEVDVNMGGLDSSIDPGDDDNFTVRLRNRTEQQFQPLRVVFTIRLNGLEPQHVRINSAFGELTEQGGGGQIRLAQGYFLNQEGRRNSSITIPYRIAFTNSIPGGRAEVTAQAVFGDQVLGTDQDEIEIEGQPAPSQTTGAPTATQGPVAEASGPPLAPVDGQQSASAQQDSGTPTVLYILGGMLVVAGGVMLWLLFRRPRRQPALVGGAPGPDTGPFIAPSRLSHPIYPPPNPRQATPPTAPLWSTPTSPLGSAPARGATPAHAPQHAAVDPWAESAEDQFPR